MTFRGSNIVYEIHWLVYIHSLHILWPIKCFVLRLLMIHSPVEEKFVQNQNPKVQGRFTLALFCWVGKTPVHNKVVPKTCRLVFLQNNPHDKSEFLSVIIFGTSVDFTVTRFLQIYQFSTKGNACSVTTIFRTGKTNRMRSDFSQVQ